MKKYQELLSATVKEYFKFSNYHIFSLPFRIFFVILLIPVHLVFLFFVILYQVMYFFFMMIRVPADYLRETIDENSKYHPATQVVVFLIVYPTKFFFDLGTAFSLVCLAWVFFIIQPFAYMGSFGNIKFQPYLMRATVPVAKPKPSFCLSKKHELIMLFIIVGALIVLVISILTIDLVKAHNTYNEASSIAVQILENENMTNGYILKGAFYNKSNDVFGFFIIYAGIDKYYITTNGFWEDTGISSYRHFLDGELNTSILTRKIDNSLS